MFIREIPKGRSKAYQFTVDPMNKKDDIFLQGIRKFTRQLNKNLRDEAKAHARPVEFQFRLSYTPKKVARKHAWKYKDQPGGKRRIRLEDASAFDVYLHRKIMK